jgi:hypothetical protein
VLEKWIAAQEAGRFTQAAAREAVSIALNGRHDPYDHATGLQAVRVLAKLEAAGALVKVRRGEAGPDGRPNAGRQPDYYTPEAYAAAQARAAGDARVAAAASARWAGIHDELAAMGLHPVTPRGEDIRLGPATWAELLRKARD